MGVKTTWVPFGRAAAESLSAEISAIKADEPLAPVTVLVPSNHVGVAVRRVLASGELGPVCGTGKGIVGINFSTTYRLAELIGAATLADDNHRPVSTPVIAAAVRAVLSEAPGVFQPVADHPTTESALVASYRELRDAPPDALDQLAATSERAADVVRIHRAAHERLQGAWYDETDLLDAAAAKVRAGDAHVDGLDNVVLYLPHRISLHAAVLLRAIGEHGQLSIIAGHTGHTKADKQTIEAVARIGGAGPTTATTSTADTTTTRMVTASDADEEVRHAVRVVLDAIRNGTRLDRIAILHANADPYARLVHEQLGAAGVKSNGTSFVSLDGRTAPRALVQFLTLADGNFGRGDVFAWLTAAPLRHDGPPVPVSAWERLSRKAGVVAGRDGWDERLELLAAGFERDADAAEADPEDDRAWMVHRNRRDAEQARALRIFVLGVIDSIGAAAEEDKPWADHVGWINDHLDAFLGNTGSERWPRAERNAAEKLDRALTRLAALDAVEGAVSLDVFTRTLMLELEADLGRVGTFGDGVFVGSMQMGVGLDLDLVVMLGLAEGSYPSVVREDSLLPDDERAATGVLALRRDRIDNDHRDFVAAMAAGATQVLCVPRGDLRKSSRRVPSRWVLDVASQLADERWWSEDFLESGDTPWLTHIPSYEAGLRRTALPATEQDYRLRAMLRDGGTSTDTKVNAGLTVVRARRSGDFTRFDGNVSGQDVPSPVDIVMSATRLEAWAKCPFKYFVLNVLGAQPVDNPEEALQISPADKGTLVHNALEAFILEVLGRAEPHAHGAAWTDADRARLLELSEESCDAFEARGLTGRALFWRRDRSVIMRDLATLLDKDDDHRRRFATRPLAAEMPFGMEGRPEVAVTLPDQRVVQFRGKADRVDIGEDGTLYVVDYKTGSTYGFTDISAAAPTVAGKKLQLPLYAAAAVAHNAVPDAAVHAAFWFISDKQEFKRIGYPVTEEVLDGFRATVGVMVEGIEAGVFPNYPTTSSTFNKWVDCDPCEPDGLGVVDLHRAWARKADDPALEVFRRLMGDVADEEAADA